MFATFACYLNFSFLLCNRSILEKLFQVSITVNVYFNHFMHLMRYYALAYNYGL